MSEGKVKAKLLDFKPVSEPFIEYELEDGTRVKIRVFLVSAAVMVDEKGQPVTRSDGTFHYNLQINSHLTVIPKHRIVLLPPPQPQISQQPLRQERRESYI